MAAACAAATNLGGCGAHHPVHLALRQKPPTLERRVLRLLGPGSRILSVRVVPRRADVPRVLREFGPVTASEDGGPAWIVLAHGLFEPVDVPPGSRRLTTPRDGYVVFDDRSGDELGYGWGRP